MREGLVINVFFCDETYKPEHTCRRLQALLIEACTQEEQPIPNEIFASTVEKVLLVESGKEPLIQLNVISKEKWLETMQLKREI